MTTRYKSDAMEAIHSAATALHDVGAISKTTLREFDVTCIAPNPDLPPEGIKRLRERYRLSQPVFARYLNTSESTVQKWETGAKRPSPMAMKLLDVVDKHGLAILA